MIKTFEVVVDVEKELYSSTQPLFSVSENDLDSIDLLFEIRQDNNAVDLTGQTVELAILKPSGFAVYQECEITAPTEGKAIARLSQQAYVEFGIHIAEVIIRNANTMVVTSPFSYKSREGILGTEEIESGNDFSAIQQALFLYDKKPILTEGRPTTIPEYVGQTALDTLNRVLYIANDNTVESWVAIVQTTEGGTGMVSWETILNKPLTFPSEPHTHEIADVNGLITALEGKADVGTIGGGTEPHTHEIADVNGLQIALDGKADDGDLAGKSDVGHTHDFADLTNKPATYPPENHTHDFDSITGKPISYPAEPHTHDFTSIVGKPATYPPDPHSHSFAEITDKPATYPPDIHTHDFATGITGKPATYPPDVHGHVIEDVAGLRAELDSKADAGAGGGIIEPHQHDIEDVRGLQTALDGKVDDAEMLTKADADHTHGFDQITGKPLTYPSDPHTHDFTSITGKPATYPAEPHTHDFTSITGKPATYPSDPHGHEIADVNGLQGALDGKADAGDLPDLANYNGTLGVNSGSQVVPARFVNVNGTIAMLVHASVNAFQSWDANNGAKPFAIEGYGGALLPLINLRSEQVQIDGVNLSSLYSAINHAHEMAEINGLQLALDEKAGVLDLNTKADLDHVHSWLEITDKPTSFPPDAHGHTSADITDFGTAVSGAIPPEYLTQTEGDARYQPTGTIPAHDHPEYLTQTEGDARYQPTGTIPAHTHTETDVTFGTKNAKTYVDDADNYILFNVLDGLKLWKGTQAEYDAIPTKDANTLYFIV